MEATLHCAAVIAHVTGNPFQGKGKLEIIENGALHVDTAGQVVAVGSQDQLARNHPDIRRIDHGQAWLLPGFVDGHIHFPQLYVTAVVSGDLLTWLREKVYPAEAAFADEAYARKAARRFLERLRAHGTTSALVFGSQFAHATRALFDAARTMGIRIISGLTLMDHDSPAELCLTPDEAYDHSANLIASIQDDPLLGYAVTPRYALACSPAMMDACAALVRDFPDTILQTHINESKKEIENVLAGFPGDPGYAAVYDRFRLLSARTVLAHNVHPTTADLDLIRDRGCSVCHCPGSNAFLGSGFFSLRKHINHGIPVLTGTDVAAGPNFSIGRELVEVYKTVQLDGERIDAAGLLYLGTLAGAEALRLNCGNFTAGKDADFVVIGTGKDYLAERLDQEDNLADRLLPLLAFHETRDITAVYVAGRHLEASC